MATEWQKLASGGWQTLERTRRVTRGEPRITIGKTGYIAWNRQTHEMMGEPEYVTIRYNSEHRLLGIAPAAQRDPDAFPVRERRINQKITGYTVTARASLEKAELLPDATWSGKARSDGGKIVFTALNNSES
jgi:hypothetical protein